MYWKERKRSGALALAWKNNIQLDVVGQSMGHIDAIVTQGDKKTKLIGFYGNSNTQLRRFSWELLERLASDGREPLWSPTTSMRS